MIFLYPKFSPSSYLEMNPSNMLNALIIIEFVNVLSFKLTERYFCRIFIVQLFNNMKKPKACV